MVAKPRIALYGGTFDPVHLGHLEVARRVRELFEIEKVVFIPAQVAPHKIGKDVTDPLHRYTMLALATQDDPNLVISKFEIEAPGRCYTVETLTHFLAELGSSNELFFIMGADSWSEIKTWREWERLLTMVNHVVVTRPGHEIETHTSLKNRIVDLRGQQQSAVWQGDLTTKIFLTDSVMMDVSATRIRELAAEGEYSKLTDKVPRPVANYIKKYRIYQE